ncbi:MAG: DUF6951 family protein, partial [Rectinemataceae bacterium]
MEARLSRALHAACPLPSAMVKVVEIACGLALPREGRFEPRV